MSLALSLSVPSGLRGAQPCALLGRASGAPVPLLLCLNKQSCVPMCAKRVCSPAVSPKTRRQEWKPELARNEGDDANLETDQAPGNGAPLPRSPARASSQSGHEWLQPDCIICAV